MKSCPSCHQTYSDGLEICPNDGTTLTSSYSGSSDYRFQTPSGQNPQSQPGWQPPPPGWGYYQPGQPPPQGYTGPYPQSSGGEGLATAALFTGIGTIASMVLGYVLIFAAVSSYPFNTGLAGMGGILVLLSFIVGITALILGIVAASMSSRNPNVSKAKAIVGLCLGAIPLLLLIIGLIAGSPFRRF